MRSSYPRTGHVLYGRSRWWLPVAAVLGVAIAGVLSAAPALDPLARVARVLDGTPLIDGHNDLPWLIRQRFNSSAAAADLTKDTSGIVPPAGDVPLKTALPRFRRAAAECQS